MPTNYNAFRTFRAAMAGSTAVCALAFAPAALAQDSAPEEETPSLETSGEAIIVTGSRIARRDYDSESPLVTVSQEMLENSASVSLDQSLTRMPQFVAGQNQATSAGDVQPNPTSSPGISTVNLRGLGANRTLVLLDGRRTQPANAALLIDINTIPKAALDGVEVITGGAGATYGADAVSGVVNFKLKRHFTGITLDGQFGFNTHGDGKEYELSALVGSDFADGRGNAMVGIGVAKRSVIEATDRSFFREQFTDPDSNVAGTFPQFFGYQFAPAANNTAFYPRLNNPPTQAAIDAAFAGVPGYAPGDVRTQQSVYLFFNPSPTGNSTVFSNVYGQTSGITAPGYTGSAGYPDYRYINIRNAAGTVIAKNLVNNQSESYLSLPLQRYSLFANAYYDVTDDITGYVQGNFNEIKTETSQGNATASYLQWGTAVPFDSATCGAAVSHAVPTTLCNVLRSRPSPNDPWELVQPLFGVAAVTTENTNTSYEMLAGVRGNLGLGDWTFDAFASHGKTIQQVLMRNVVDQSRLQALVSAPNYGVNFLSQNFRLGTDAKCTSGVNPFTQVALSQDCIDIISANLKNITTLTQNQVEIGFQGSLFELPAGPLQAAIGADYRDNSYKFDPDDGFSGNNINTNPIGLFVTKPTQGKVEVKEIFGELLIPVLHDLPFVQQFDINAGYRLSDYNTAGSVSTWKVTGNLEATDFLSFRGGYQIANRAPNVAELFTPGTFSTVAWPDADACSTLTSASYGNVASNPDRQKVIDLCNKLPGMPAGSTLVNSTFFSPNFNPIQPLGRDQTIGNIGLTPEEARTITAGFVLRTPGMTDLGRFALTVDYYNIKIKKAIAPATTAYVYQECFNANGTNPNYDVNNEFCQLILRRPNDGGWVSTTAQYRNLGLVSTAGVDATLDWAIPVPGLNGDSGTFAINANFTYLEKYDFQLTATSPVLDYADSSGTVNVLTPPFGSQFRWKSFTTASYNFGPGEIALSWRHLPRTRNVAKVLNPAATQEDTAAYDWFGLSARVEAMDGIEFRAGVDNLFDRKPPRVGVNTLTTGRVGAYNTASGQTDPGAYDVIGRAFYVGAKIAM
ncbi:TonB-dependent receptor domain-containing protein [Tsuneonella sp. HG222]